MTERNDRNKANMKVPVLQQNETVNQKYLLKCPQIGIHATSLHTFIEFHNELVRYQPSKILIHSF